MTAVQTPQRSWDERLRDVRRLYPSAGDDWRQALADDELVAKAILDLIRVEHTPERRGPRPVLEDTRETRDRIRQLFGEDYTTLPFAEAFAILVGQLTVRQVAGRTGLSRSRCQRLLSGEVDPTGRDMEMAAAGFGKPPVYWTEYRAGLLCAALAERMTRMPESSVGLVRKLAGI